MELDRIDGRILSALQKNARLSNKELAAELGIAASTCLQRVRRLTEAGVLRRFQARVDPKALGIGLQAMVALQLKRHDRNTVLAFRAHVLALKEVVAAYHMAGRNDFLLHVAVRDSDHLREMALSAFSSRQEVAHLETSLIYEHAQSPELPSYLL
ncbi:MAG: Lrp/AsnC family transcriptional regulator [Deltaproteobacteria bacterium]|nr:Lrp/AsnC family transcriptional regulator [Deltaproteobacteria bacterium]